MAQKKRNLLKELKKSTTDIDLYLKNKITLRTHTIQEKPRPYVDAIFVRRTREKLNMSRSIFALTLRVSYRTLEKWEQGKTVPNDQASALILMIDRYPDMLERLAEI